MKFSLQSLNFVQFKVGESQVTLPLPGQRIKEACHLQQFNILSQLVKFTKCGAASDIMNVFKKVMAISTIVKKATSRKKEAKSLKLVKKLILPQN